MKQTVALYGVALKARIDARATELSLKHNADFKRGPLWKGKDNELFPCACAMVEVALDFNPAIRPLYLDVIRAWAKPGCESFKPTTKELFGWSNPNGDEKTIDDYVEAAKPRCRNALEAYKERCIQQGTTDSDMGELLALADKFILQSFNGPIEPMLQQRWVHKDRPVPKYKIRVTAEGAPRLLVAFLYLAWCEHESMDLQALDRMKMGQNYELVTSGDKPSTEWGRSQKPRINKLCRDMGMRFISYDTIRNGAEKWYQARVVRGSVVDATSDYEINNPSTFQRLIQPYDTVAGLR